MKLQIYDPLIYPYKIWVAVVQNSEELDEIASKFVEIESYRDIKYTEWERKCYAITSEVKHKIIRKNGALIIFNIGNAEETVDTIAHESVHAAGNLFEYIGEPIKNNEAFAYMVGFVAKCCDETLKNN